MVEIVVHKNDTEIVLKAPENSSMLELLNDHNLTAYAPCGGKGRCGKCKILLSGPANPITPVEQARLSEDEVAKGVRLACQTLVAGSAHIRIVDGFCENTAKKDLKPHAVYPLQPIIRQKTARLGTPTLQKGNSLVDVIKQELGEVPIGFNLLQEIARNIQGNQRVVCTLYDDELIDLAQDTDRSGAYGIAVDIGTTTVVCYLLDLTTGVQLAAASRQNPQCMAGADVISRIHYTVENKTGLGELQTKIIQTIDELIGELGRTAGISSRHIYLSVLVGNATMQHLFLGLACRSLSLLPFSPVTTDALTANAVDFPITNMNPRGKIVFMPGIGGFVGSDTVGAILAAEGIGDRKKCQLLLDLGTNGEIVLSTPTGRYACSTAAGPAFEGANIKWGMQAVNGAIDSVHLAEDLFCHTIGDQPPRGICGSGLIDAVSELVKAGMVGASGKIVDPEEIASPKLAGRIAQNGRKKEIILVAAEKSHNGEQITLTQQDIRQLQLAKGAIRAGVNILMRVAGVAFADIDTILLAGAFGNHLKRDSAAGIGLFPGSEADKVIALGNGAGEGAKLALCDRNRLLTTSKLIAEKTIYVEISNRPDFQDEFVAGMILG